MAGHRHRKTRIGHSKSKRASSVTWRSVMKAAIVLSSVVVLLAFSEAHGQPEGETVSGFQCVGINIPGLHLSQDDLRTGAKFPMIRDEPRGDAKAVRRISTIIYVAWPPVVKNG